jgi:RES domain-containing protein
MLQPDLSAMQAEDALRAIEAEALTCGISEQLHARLLSVTKGMLIPRRRGTLSALYRSRRNEGSKLFSSVSDLWHPPAEQAPRGRLNGAGRPMLYCSDGPSVALFEQRPKAGDLVTIIEFALSPLLVIAIGELSQQLHHGRTQLPGSEQLNTAAWLHSFGDTKVRYSAALDALLGRWLSEGDPVYYVLTNWIARFLLTMDDLDGLVYPTVVWDEGLNIALRPCAAKRLLRPQRAFVVRVDDPTANKQGQSPGRYEAVSTAISESGEISWDVASPSGG